MSPPPDIFLSSVADQIVKTNRPGQQRMNEAYQWSGKCGNSLVCDSSSSLFSLFSGYHSYNTEPFKRDIFSHLFKNCRGIFDHGTTF